MVELIINAFLVLLYLLVQPVTKWHEDNHEMEKDHLDHVLEMQELKRKEKQDYFLHEEHMAQIKSNTQSMRSYEMSHNYSYPMSVSVPNSSDSQTWFIFICVEDEHDGDKTVDHE